jgi:hypothetical protein
MRAMPDLTSSSPAERARASFKAAVHDLPGLFAAYLISFKIASRKRRKSSKPPTCRAAVLIHSRQCTIVFSFVCGAGELIDSLSKGLDMPRFRGEYATL